MDDESAALRMQTDAYDDEGREDDLKMELQSLEGLTINCRSTMTINHPSKIKMTIYEICLSNLTNYVLW